MVCTDSKEFEQTIFWDKRMTKEQRNSAWKRYSTRGTYATLYMKLIAFFADKMRGLLRPGQIGETCLAMRASTFGGDTFPRKNWRQTCTATEKLALQAYFLFFFWMTTCEVINSEKLYIVSLANISWRMCSVFFAWKWSRPMVYFNSLKDVSIPQRKA